jgi:DNA adenine methylase
MAIAPVLKYPGSKWNIAKWIISFMPEHEVYLEPFFGSGAVFFNKRSAKLEVINDINQDVVSLFKVMRERPEELATAVNLTPHSREEHVRCFADSADELEQARRFLVRCWQTHGGGPVRSKSWKDDLTGNQGLAGTWDRLPRRIIDTAKRLKAAVFECLPAAELIPRYNNPNTLIYADPPYLLDTRSGKFYSDEMNNNGHLELLSIINKHTGPVLLSGYQNDLYDNYLSDWMKQKIITPTEKGLKREEVLWLNPIAVGRLRMPLFEASESR